MCKATTHVDGHLSVSIDMLPSMTVEEKCSACFEVSGFELDVTMVAAKPSTVIWPVTATTRAEGQPVLSMVERWRHIVRSS